MQPTRGILTTEFLTLILMGLVVTMNGLDNISIEASTLNTFIGACIAYIAQRGYVKGEATKAAAVLAAAKEKPNA